MQKEHYSAGSSAAVLSPGGSERSEMITKDSVSITPHAGEHLTPEETCSGELQAGLA